MTPQAILEYFERRTDAIVAAITAIIDAESPSYDAASSERVVQLVEAQFRDTGAPIEVERIVEQGVGVHLLITAFASAPGKPLLLLGHTDTVHPVGTREKNPTRIEGDKFYGCGGFDMKANIVLMIEALRFMSENGMTPARPLRIFLSCDEEVGSYSGRAILEQEAAKSELCLVLEPSAAGRVKTGRKGTGVYALKAHGIPAHAGLEPEKGASAIRELARQIPIVEQFADDSQGTTVNVCTISGGTASNVIPEFAECSVDVRFGTMAEATRVDAAIKSIQAFDEKVALKVVGGVNRPPMERTGAVVTLYENARGAAASFGYDLGETQVGGASDGNFVGAMGIPVLDGLGINGDGAHTLHEHILVTDIAKRAALLTLLSSSL